MRSANEPVRKLTKCHRPQRNVVLFDKTTLTLEITQDEHSKLEEASSCSLRLCWTSTEIDAPFVSETSGGQLADPRTCISGAPNLAVEKANSLEAFVALGKGGQISKLPQHLCGVCTLV